jgi:hypothetical protein
MISSRSVKTLGMLVASLVVGTVALVLMETQPAAPVVQVPLEALAQEDAAAADLQLIRQTDDGIRIQYIRWRNIVIHDTGRDGPEVAGQCHFLIGQGEILDDGQALPTSLWRRQMTGDHVHVPGFDYASDSIGICLLGDLREDRPTRQQMERLVGLVRALQSTCAIPRDRVYVHGDLGQSGCPGGNFPAAAFRRRLIPPRQPSY